jgi:hypothetical protein
MTEDEKYEIIKFFDNKTLLVVTSRNGLIRTSIFNLDNLAFYDVTDENNTDTFDYSNPIVFTSTYDDTTFNFNAYSVNRTDSNFDIQIKKTRIKGLTKFAVNRTSKMLFILKNGKYYSISYAKFFVDSDDWTLIENEPKFIDDKEFVTALTLTSSFYIVMTYKNIYAKPIDNTGDWFTIPYNCKSSFDIKTLDGDFYDVTSTFWVYTMCVDNSIIIKSIDGKIYHLLISNNDGIIYESMLPQILINDCYTNLQLKSFTFKNKYTIEYSEFECKCTTKH